MSRRFQFSLKWLFVAMLVVAAFFGGMATNERLAKLKREKAARMASARPTTSIGQRLRASAQRNAALIESQRKAESR